MVSGRSHVSPPETDAGTLPSKPQPRGNTQINGDRLILDMSYPEICLSYWPNSTPSLPRGQDK